MISRPKTIAQVMMETGGRSSGFDYLRILLAISVVLMHGTIVSSGQAAEYALWTGWMRPLIRAILPMFFALSGFLVAGSLGRANTLGTFLGLRAIRIFPALCVEVLLSAFVLGPLMTSRPLSSYFGDRMLWHYLMNAVGHIHYMLPGVFGTNPFPNIVNGQLWTVPYELYCYLVLGALSVAGILRYRVLGPIGVVLLVLIDLWHGRSGASGAPVIGPVSGTLLIASFLAGVSIWLYRDRLKWSRPALLASTVVSLCLLGWTPFGDSLAPFTVGYLTVALGLMNPARIAFIRGADYSYGIYLYGFVIQQTLAALGVRSPLVNGMASVVIAAGFAALSWHFVERPALRLRHPLIAARQRIERARGRSLEGLPPG